MDAASSITDALRDVDVIWVARGEKPPDHAWRFCTRWLDPRPQSAALWFLENPLAFQPSAPQAEKPAVALFVPPNLDEVVALAMWAWERLGRGTARQTPAWDEVAHYADAARQGFQLEAVDPTRAPQAVYRAIVDQRLGGDGRRDRRDGSGFLETALWLVELLVLKVQEGKSLFKDDLFSEATGNAFLAQYLDLLRADERRYREDLRGAKRFLAHVPPEHTRRNRAATIPLLAVERPRAIHFHYWARQDRDAPDGAGWPLLLIEKQPVAGVVDVEIVATPDCEATVDFLAEPLTDAERRVAGPGAEPWYDGRHYGRRRVASPELGTRLPFTDVIGVIRIALSFGRAPSRRPWRSWQELAKVAVVTAFPVVALLASRVAWTPRDARPPVARDQRLEGTAPPELARRLQQAVSTGRRWALVIGEQNYHDTTFAPLNTAADDAKAIAEILHDRFEFATELPPGAHGARAYPLVLLDATREEIYDAIKWLGKAVARDDSVLIYYGGHGGQYAGETYWAPVVKLSAGERALPGSPHRVTRLPPNDSTAGWISAHDLETLARGLGVRHLLVVSDSCFAGSMIPTRGVKRPEPTAKGERVARLEQAALARSARLLASGADEPVFDGERGRNSVFANGFLHALAGFREDAFTISDIMPTIQDYVARQGQRPQYNELNFSREGGELLFIRSPPVAPTNGPPSPAAGGTPTP